MTSGSEAQPLLSFHKALQDADRDVRNGFIRKVYGILSAQLVLTVLVAAPFCTLPKTRLSSLSWVLLLSTLVMFATLCAMVCMQDICRKYPHNYCILGVFTAAMGVTVGFTSAMYTWQSVLLAAGLTTAIFLGMTVVAFTTKIDLTGYGMYAMGACFCVFAFGFALSIMSLCGVVIQWLYQLYNFMVVLLFTFYIVFDTQMITGGNHQVKFEIDDYCFAALNLYMDIINLFLALLRIFGDRN
mmetsp:Transcript_952/g.2119  ORF Transcript_952/g.2119 Transcript_952/m.2119 type:complete len:242 (-) Transcript_952:147-872(-)